jgi:4,5-DOPA dioxygenase extradiol
MTEGLTPVLFVGHGSPTNANEDNEFSRAWESVGREIIQPKAILCISAHWETDGPMVTAMEKPRTIHDFGGFPRELYEMKYPSPGSPELAETIRSTIKTVDILPDTSWGLDHGTWSVLCRMFPAADIPVLQLSLDLTRDGAYHYNLGRELAFLREQGVMIIGSGNIVHNLMVIHWGGRPFDWAEEFDTSAKRLIREGDHAPLIHFEELGKNASLSINSGEHYLPLLYALALQNKGEPVEFFNESIFAGSISMRGLIIGKWRKE